MTADSDEYPTALANALDDAMEMWNECDGIDADDLSLRECIENDWSLAEFLALYVRRLPVEQRMAAMGMEREATDCPTHGVAWLKAHWCSCDDVTVLYVED